MAGLIWILLSAYLLGCTSQDQENITAESGQNVTLTCQARNYSKETLLWSRADLGDEYVLLYRDELFVADNQHPSFKDRVDLQDKQMKDGDVSLNLKDVKINDTGTYECCVVETGKFGLKPISSITLSVVDPPGSVGLIVGVVVAAALVVAAVAGFVIYRNHKKAKEVLLFSSKYLSPLIIKQSPAVVPTSQRCQ
ncbi:coxsackievirus and adenovirus receptor homolog [Oreochromis aureus]|uniref:coxsackievirus and adenovirus receptor homolog n=1 Tax=Oreochromis aureus TaxID=47969 RepID=UPI001952DBC0|nr:coxsackievirus and adenovirus receptor homolog [Oreochromis aureus]